VALFRRHPPAADRDRAPAGVHGAGVGRALGSIRLIGALRHLPAKTAGIASTFEPVVASLVAWVWLDERLDAAHLVGGLIALAGIFLAKTAP
jgi:drug/metabolite transporter (DMT)-like permease